MKPTVTSMLPSRRLLRVWALTAIMAAAAAVLVMVRFPRAAHVGFHLPWEMLAGAWILALIAPVRFAFRRQGSVVSFTEIPLLVGAVFSSPRGAVLAGTVAACLIYAVHRRQPLYKVALNVASVGFSTGAALHLYSLVRGTGSPIGHRGWLAALTAAAVYNVLTTVCVLVAITLADRAPDRRELRDLLVSYSVVTAVNSSLGIVTICILWVDPYGGLFLAAIALVVGLGYRAHQQLRARHAVLERIHDFTQRTDGHSDVESFVDATLTAIRETMAADGAELFVHQGAGWLHYRSDESGLVLTSSERLPGLERAVLGTAKSLLLARSLPVDEQQRLDTGGRGIIDAMSVPLPGDELEGIITVTNHQHPTDGFESVDVRALGSMASHTAVALQSAMLLERLHREVEEKEYQALHDALTGLPNRTMFAARVEELLGEHRAGRPIGTAAVMLLDLDEFKEVNDTLGHQVGDTVLKATAVRLLNAVGRSGTVARLGGDEFAVLVPALDGAEATRAAEAVKAAIEQPIEEDNLLIEVRVSVGVALAGLHGDDVATLMRLADVAMYAAKESHAGVILYEVRHDHYSPRRLTLAGELRQAMATRQLTIAYQPQLDLHTGKVTAVEALVRWSHPRHGMIPPDEFIPVAEQTGLIVPLTDYVLTETLEQQARWRRRGFDLVVAVNLSPRVVQHGHLPQLVRQRLEAANVPPDRLTLELTETGLATDPARVASILHQLADMGVRTSIDDFGTGYSSLSRLTDLPVAEVKIDKSFVFAMAGGGGETLVRSIIDLGHNLNLRVIAEGVEDGATLERLRQLRCHAVQGYFLSRALAAPVLEAWFEEHNIEAESSAVIVPMRKVRSAPGF